MVAVIVGYNGNAKWSAELDTARLEVTAHLVIPLVTSSELRNQSNEQKFTNLRQFGVDNGDKGGKDGRER